jgi:putative glycosyltransferase (TIGR04348 family)
MLRAAGHRVRLARNYDGRPCDLMIALHAWRSHAAIAAYRKERPGAPLIVVLTGTDLYRDLRRSAPARRSLEWATRLVVLHPLGAEVLPPRLRAKTRAIVQSAEPPRGPAPRPFPGVTVCVLGHLRREKDPLRAAMAVRRLPAGSGLRVLHAGRALSPELARRARAEMSRNPRYRWLGERSRRAALRLLARSRAMVLSSRMEGGANVISEAVAAGAPILASRIHGTVGLLGVDYPGLYPLGETRALRALLLRLERDPAFTAELRAWLRRLRPRFRPTRERRAWARLVDETVRRKVR